MVCFGCDFEIWVLQAKVTLDVYIYELECHGLWKWNFVCVIPVFITNFDYLRNTDLPMKTNHCDDWGGDLNAVKDLPIHVIFTVLSTKFSQFPLKGFK